MAAYMVKGDSFVPDKVRVCFEQQLAIAVANNNIDLAPDGKRIVALMPAVEFQGSARGAEPRRAPGKLLGRAAAESAGWK
jgi:hypothetical protein